MGALLPSVIRNVWDFGAKGDGGTDDTDALLATIANANLYGGAVFFPPGEYWLADPADRLRIVANDIALIGDPSGRAVLHCNKARDTGLALEGSNIFVDNLSFITGHSSRTLLIQYGAGKSNITLNQCKFIGNNESAGLALMVVGGNKKHIAIKNSRFVNCFRGISAYGQISFLNILDNSFTGIGDHGVRLTGLDTEPGALYRVRVAGNVYEDPFEGRGPGSVGYPLKTESSGPKLRYVSVVGNYVRGTDKEWGSDTGTPDQYSFNMVDGLYFAGNESIDGGDMGLTLEPGVSNFRVVGNHFERNDISGMWVDGSDGVVSGNVCVDNGVDRAGSGSTNLGGLAYGPNVLNVVEGVNVGV